MKKKILFSLTTMITCLIIPFSLNAASNRIEIVHNNHNIETKENNGYTLLNTINTEKSDLVNGDLAVEITFDNSKKAEIFYIIDNGQEMESIKNNFIDLIKKQAIELEKLENVSQGVIAITDENISLKQLDNKNIEMQLNSVKEIQSGKTNGGLLSALNIAEKNFSNINDKNLRQYIVILTSPLNENTTELKTKVDALLNNDVKFIVYGAKQQNVSDLSKVFTNTLELASVTGELEQANTFNTIRNTLPSKREMEVTLTFDSFITNNFDIKDIKISDNRGTATYNKEAKELVWKIGEINPNEITKLTYTLSLKGAVDESVEKINLRTNRQIKIKENGILTGTLPSDEDVNEPNKRCSPVIRVLREAIDNPKTGLAEYIVFGSCLISVAAITILILNSKKQFNRI